MQINFFLPMTLNKKKIDGKLVPNEVLSKIRGYDGTMDDEAIKVKIDDDLQKEGVKYFGGKRKTKKNKNSKRKTRKH